MNKKIYIIIILLISFGKIINAQISDKEILSATESFISENLIFENYSHNSNVLNIVIANKTVAYLVLLKPEGYIIFTSSKNLHPVFSYSENGSLNIKKAIKNPIFKSLLNNLSKQEEIIKLNSEKYFLTIQKNQKAWQELLTNSKNTKADYQYGYYLTDFWGGVNCWDNEGNFIYPTTYFTPNHYSPGCVAISASQILNYYQWPPVGTGSHTDVDSDGSSTGSYYAGFGRTKYDWKNMLDDYQGEYSSDIERRAVGRLMYHVGVAVDMDYEDLGSTSHVNRVPNAFSSYFRCTGHYQTFSWSEFGSRLRQNLENGMPVEFGVEADDGEKHACVCDGYRYNEGDTKYYHLNMGWWNWYGGNAWYNIFGDFSALGYTIITGGVFDIIPEPMMNPVERTSDYHTFIVNWNVSKTLNWDVFELQESFDNGSWTTISNSVTDTLYERTVSTDGIYKYRVRPRVAGNFYSDSYSNVGVVQVGELIFLDFDGDDSFFVNDSYNKLDVSDNWTYEAWVKVDSYNSNDWSVIMDRRTVFSLYLINDADADFALRFVTRDGSDNIGASLRSDNSSVNLEFNKWFHVAVSFDGIYARLFLNGKLIEESNDNLFNLSSSSNALNIGARYWGTYSRYINGKIDEIRLSDTARFIQEFCPDRFEVYKDDNNTQLLLNLQYGTGTSLFDASHNFLGINLRGTPNTANWQTEDSPVVNIQAENEAACSGNVFFEIDASNTDNYQWQINNGTGFINFTDDANISGSNSNILNINDVSVFPEDNIIRCILSNTTVPKTCSQDVTLSVYGNCTVWNGINWSNGVPDASKSAIIDANYTSDDFLTTDNIIINKNDTLFINENYTLKVNGDFINKGTLFLKSENAEQIPGTFIHFGSISNYGEMIAQNTFSAPNTNIEDNSYYISSPVNTENAFLEIFDSEPDMFENTGKINEWNLLNINEKFENNKAYLYQFNNNNVAEFSGNFNTGARNENLKQIGNDDFFVFMSNPYPSYINWNTSIGWDKQNLSPAVYTYDLFNNGNSFNYSVWDGNVGIHSGNGYIKPMESYFVYMTDYRSSLNFDNDVRFSTEDVNTKKQTPDNLIRFKFETEDETIFDEAVLYFSDSESESIKPKPISETKHYTFFPSEGKKYAIKRLVNSTLDTLISVGFKTSQGGQIKFKVTEFTFDYTTPVQLKDTWTGEYRMLKLDSIYTFTASTSEPYNRFKLYFGDYVVSVKNIDFDDKVKVWSSDNNIFIRNFTNDDIIYQLFDISGKLISEGKTIKERTVIQSRNAGVNLLKLYNMNSTRVFKLNIF
ncbi:MAG: hypothetical protein DRI94_03270 [Bacteroidetes bacterium]|nr:MAG: hypothetical protein DRI94_03270 [Bacteroidota bacterium]